MAHTVAFKTRNSTYVVAPNGKVLRVISRDGSETNHRAVGHTVGGALHHVNSYIKMPVSTPCIGDSLVINIGERSLITSAIQEIEFLSPAN